MTKTVQWEGTYTHPVLGLTFRGIKRNGQMLISAQEAAELMGYYRPVRVTKDIPEFCVTTVSRAERGIKAPGRGLICLTMAGLFTAILQAREESVSEEVRIARANAVRALEQIAG